VLVSHVIAGSAVPIRSRAGTLAVVGAGFGVMSLPVLDVGTKLSFGYSVDFWDFEASVLPFFVRWAAVLLLVSVVTYYDDAVLAGGSRRRKRAQA
jgi:hypothetical protein